MVYCSLGSDSRRILASVGSAERSGDNGQLMKWSPIEKPERCLPAVVIIFDSAEN